MAVDKFGRIAGGTCKMPRGITLRHAMNLFLRRDVGNTISGDLLLNVGTDLLRVLGCGDLNGDKGFAILLGSIANQIQCQLNRPIKLETTDGFLCAKDADDIIRFGLSSTDSKIGVYQDIVLNQHFITDLHDPNNDKDAANKIYADALSYMTAYPSMRGGNTTVVDGLTYTVSASSGSDSGSWTAFQDTFDDIGWGAASNANEWIQMKYPFPISMSGFYIIVRVRENINITSWKVQASNDGTTFSDVVTTNNTAFNAKVLNKFTFSNSTKYLYWRFYIISSAGGVNVGISMLQWIPTLTDRYLKKCHVGYVPRLTSNTNYRGFTPSASSEYDHDFIAANAFNGDYVGVEGHKGEWATLYITSNFWIQIVCPAAVRIWKVGFRGPDISSRKISCWRLEGAFDNNQWVTLYTAPNPTYLDNIYREFMIDSVVKFNIYRLYCVNSEGEVPGLSTMQLFVYDD